MNPLISIIVPVYNAEKTLKRCVDSIINQIYTNWELLLIDDGSKDNSGRICDEYSLKDNRIKVFHKQNGGVSSARNLGLNKAKGEWISFVDSDDWIFNDTSIDDKSLIGDLVVFNSCIFDKNKGFIYPDIFKYDLYEYGDNMKNEIEKYLHYSILRTPWGKFFRKDIIDNLRFDINIRIGEDTLFMLHYIGKCNSISINKKVYYVWFDDLYDYKSKYKLSAENAIYIVHNLYDAYKKLQIKSVEFMKFIFNFYKDLSEDDFYGREYVWFGNKIIISLWNEINDCFSYKVNFMAYMKRYSFFCFFLNKYHKFINLCN